MGWFSKLWPFGKGPDLPLPAATTEPSAGESSGPTEMADEKFPGMGDSPAAAGRVAHGEPPDDEDAMIETYELHKNTKHLVIKKLKEEGIDCKATTGNDPNGDILIFRKKDKVRVQRIIWSLNAETPKEVGRLQDTKRVRRRRP